jgi:3-oxoacyl-[acyl-carrier protein] reductase
MRLANKVALITGAASGFGRASAQLFAREGCQVVVVDLREDGGRETLSAIQADGGEAIFVKADVAEASDAEGMVRAAVEAYGHLDIVFNNAGIPMRPIPTEEIDNAVWDRLFAINVKGVWHGCKYAIPVMKAQGSGVILNTASTAGVRPRPNLVAYAATKGAVITLTRGLALELASHKIRVCSISPVAADTPMFPGFLQPGADLDEARRVFVGSVPLGRLALPNDVAQAALYLASDDASMVTGINLEVDGGRDL